MDKNAIGKRIREAREAIDLSGQELGDKLSPPVKRQSVNQWENGKTFPDLKRIEQLSYVLKKTPEWILFGEAKTGELDSDEIKLLKNFRLLSDHSKASILVASQVLTTEGFINSGKTP